MHGGQRMALTVGIIFFLVGSLVVTGGFYMIKTTRDFLETGTRAMGTVILVERSGSDYYPVISFRDEKGRPIEARSLPATAYVAGDSVTVIYDPLEPYGARIENSVSVHDGIFFSCFGSLFFFVGLLSIVFHRRFNENGAWEFGKKSDPKPPQLDTD